MILVYAYSEKYFTCFEPYVESIPISVALGGRESHLQRIGESLEWSWSVDAINIICVNKAILLNPQTAATVTGICDKCELHFNYLQQIRVYHKVHSFQDAPGSTITHLFYALATLLIKKQKGLTGYCFKYIFWLSYLLVLSS